jgi:hypothetical protein
MRPHLVSLAIALLCWACDRETDEQRADRFAAKVWNEPCADQAGLLATTTGSPSSLRCPNRLHHMQVEVATHPSNEEAAALVFCKCEVKAADSGGER